MNYVHLEREDPRRARDLTETWNQLVPIENLDSTHGDLIARFCTHKRITIKALAKLGTRFVVKWRERTNVPCLAFAGSNATGIVTAIKYRPIHGTSHDSFAEAPSVWLRPIVAGNPTSLDWLVAEGETDGARLYDLVGDRCSILIMPAGANAFKAEWASVIPRGASVGLCLDADEYGDAGAERVSATIGGTIRVRPPVEGGDWCDWDGDRDAFLRILGDAKGNAHRKLVVKAAEVKSRSIRWGWPGRVAQGCLTVVTGEEGIAKSVLAAWQLARMTRGELSGEWEREPIDVLVIASEDGIADTWRPRLDLAGADLERVWFLNLDHLGIDWNLRDGIDAIRAAIAATGARFVYIDSALDHMPPPKAGESINSPTFVRAALAPLRYLVREMEVGGEFSMHPPKARGASFRDLVQASQAFTAIPRIGLLVAWHPEDREGDPNRRRVLIRGKGNAGRDPGALEFRVVGREYLHDDGRTTEREVVADVQPSGVTISDLRPGRVVGEHKPTKAERAAEIIAEELADGDWHDAQPIRERLEREGANNNKVVADAKRRLGVEGRQCHGAVHGGWEWRIWRNTSDPSGNSETLRLPRATLLAKVTLTPKNTESLPTTVRVSELPEERDGPMHSSQGYSRDGLHASNPDAPHLTLVPEAERCRCCNSVEHARRLAWLRSLHPELHQQTNKEKL